MAVLAAGGSSGCRADGTEVAPGAQLSPAGVAVSLHQLEAAVRDAQPAAAARLAAPGDPVTAGRLADAVTNAGALGVTDLRLRPGALPESMGQDAVLPVRVTWGLRGLGGQRAQMTVSFGFGLEEGRVVVSSLGSADDPGPLWLQAPLLVTRRAGLVVASVGRAPRVTEAVPGAVRAVRRVLPGWRPRGLIEVPGGGSGFAAALGAEPGEYSDEAAVTTTVDGSGDHGAMTRVVVNRDGFAAMSARGAHIVLAHELTHLATGAAISPAPLWLVEGFADYVALRGSPPSDRGVVADLAWQVRRAGVPEGLPSRERFGAGGRSLAAAYQGSWLACRLIASRAGERALVRVYDRVSAGESLPRVLRDETGQGMPGLVRAWRVRLTHWRA